MCEFNDCFEAFRNAVVTIVSLTVAGVSIKQYLVNKSKYRVEEHKLKLELFNKRFNAFDVTIKLKKEIDEDVVTQEALNDFNVAYNSSFFLFPNDSGIYEQMDSIHGKFIAIQAYRKTFKKTKRQCDFYKITENLNEVNKDIDTLRTLLTPHISVPTL